jgi:hypothetical protein
MTASVGYRALPSGRTGAPATLFRRRAREEDGSFERDARAVEDVTASVGYRALPSGRAGGPSTLFRKCAREEDGSFQRDARAVKI